MRFLGKVLCKQWDHIRSRAKAQMNRRRPLGERIMSGDPDRQPAEIQIGLRRGGARTNGACRSVMNRFSALGRAGIAAIA